MADLTVHSMAAIMVDEKAFRSVAAMVAQMAELWVDGKADATET